jgi:phosphatidylglycerophosphate synthase
VSVESTLSELYPLKAAGVFGAIMGIALLNLRDHHPFPRFGVANQVTTIRALLVSLVAGLIGEAHTPVLAAAAIAVSLLATGMDGLDGWLARRTHMVSPFGARFDLEVDALLIQVLSILAWRYGKAGAWVLASGLLRYGFVAAGQVWGWLRGPLSPTRRGKAICVAQIVGLLVAVAPAVTWPTSAMVAGGTLGLLGYSFGVDIASLWRDRTGPHRPCQTAARPRAV